MAEHKPTSDPRQLWMFGGLLVLACAFFGYAVLPHLDPGKSSVAGQPAPEFVLPVMDAAQTGNRIGLSDLHGNVVVLDFWASWCGPCRAQTPIIERLSQRFSDRPVRMIGVNTSDRPIEAAKYLSEVGLSYPSVLDADGVVARAYSAFELPTIVVIDPLGKVVFRAARMLSEKELASEILKALKATGQ